MTRQQTQPPGPVRDSSPGPASPVARVEASHELIVFERTEFVKFAAATLAQAIPPMKDVATDVYRLLKEMGFTGRAVIRNSGGVDYVILSGRPGLRKILTGTRYKATNPTIVEMVIGSAGRLRSAVKGTALSIVLVGAADITIFFLEDAQTVQELGLTIAVDVAKAVAAGAAGLIAAALAAGASIAVVPVAVGIVVALSVGYALDKALPTETLVKALNTRIDSVLEDMGRGLWQLERSLLEWTRAAAPPF